MKIAAAQIPGTITCDPFDYHLEWIDRAIAQGVELIVFPELSLTGYQREQAAALAFTMDDDRLQVFANKAQAGKLTIMIGAPVAINNNLYIGLFVFLKDGSHTLYTKQFLHDGEELFYYASAEYNPVLDLNGEKISIAICADIHHPQHAAEAALANSTLYIASLFYTLGGIDEAYNELSKYAKTHSMKVLMANYTGMAYGMKAAGLSAYWDKTGKLVQKLGNNEEGLMIIEW